MKTILNSIAAATAFLAIVACGRSDPAIRWKA